MVKRLIKKSPFDPSKYNSYGSVSNLGFVSKGIKRVAANHLKSYLYANNLDDVLKSAYRKKLSTKTALLKLVSDIRYCIDQDKVVILMFLDLSDAFDTVDCDMFG